MKTLVILSLLTILFYGIGSAQQFYSFTIYGGYSLQQHPNVNYIIVNRDIPKDEFQFALTSNAPQYHIGLVKNFAFSEPFFGTIGVEYTQQTQTYSMIMTYRDDDHKYYELKYRAKSITMPAGINVRLGILDVSSGLLARFNLQLKLSGENMMGIEAVESSHEFGWYGGFGINVRHIKLGINYLSTLVRDGSGLVHRGKALEMRSVPGNLVFLVSFSY